MNFWRYAKVLPFLLFLLAPVPASSQYMYLDSNGDSLNTLDDRLNATGMTTMDVWIDTNHNREGSTATCPTGDSLTINSYEFILHADGGDVSWSGFANHQSTMTISFGAAMNSTDYYTGMGGGTILPAGRFKLASLVVSVTSGAPSIQIAGTSNLAAVFLSAFGSQCPGQDLDNTLKLGVDWFDADGVGPPDQPPMINAPLTLAATVGSDISLQIDAIDSLAQTPPAIAATGYPQGLTLNVVPVGPNTSRGTLSGHLGINDAGVHNVVWTATGQSGLSSSSTTTMDVSSQSQTSGATIIGYTTFGQNVVADEGTNGINARLGVWGAVWPYAFCQNDIPWGTFIQNGIEVEIDVQAGAMLSLDFEFMQYGTPWLNDELNIWILNGAATVLQVPLEHHGNPQACWGNLWQSPPRTIKVDLSQWPNRHVFLRIWVNDWLGHQTDALALIHSIAIRECFVTPLAPLSPEDQAIFEDHPDTPIESMLIDSMKTAVACIRNAMPPGASFVVSSAYRTQSYQSHLWELYDKWITLRNDSTKVECEDLRVGLRAHVYYHKIHNLKTHPAPKAGYHTLGRAIDASWSGITDAAIDALACSCNLYRPLKVRDRPHFMLRPCP